MGLFFLIISALCEAIWNIFLTKSKGLSDWEANIFGVLFLLGGIISFKKALGTMSLSIAIVIWSGVSLILTIIFDIYFFKTKVDFKTAIFIILCIGSILGLNYYSKQSAGDF